MAETDRPLRVFLSSTYKDLAEHRQAVRDALERVGTDVIAIEGSAAESAQPSERSRDMIQAADVFVLFVAYLDGQIADKGAKSFVEQEYDFARAAGKPVLAFLVADDRLMSSKTTEIDSESRRALESFRERVRAEMIVEFFSTPDDLAVKVLAAVTRLQREKSSNASRQADTGTRVPFDKIREYDLSGGVRQILNGAAVRASAASRRRGSVSTNLLFIEMAEQGRAGRNPGWVADFLRQELAMLNAPYEADRDQYFAHRGIPKELPTQSPPPEFLSAGTAAAFEIAQDIAQRTTGERTIHGRHLLAALLGSGPNGRPFGLQSRLDALALDAALLRERLYQWLRGYGDDDAAWRVVLLGDGAAPLLLAGFDSDNVARSDLRGRDCLDIERDVVAFATLIAARTVSPPLSIGLFGEWGSGKTFFMRRLRDEVDRVSRLARESGKPQRTQDFYKRIIQIEFNAWHYVEGNLWASLMQHIFDNLKYSGDRQPTIVEEMQKHWIEQLEFKATARSEASAKETAAQRQVIKAAKKLEDARTEHSQKATELANLSKENVQRAFLLAKAAPVVKRALHALGLQPLSEAASDLKSSLDEGRALLERGSIAFTPLFRASDRNVRWRWLLAILLGAPTLAALVALTIRALGGERIATITSFATGAATFLSGLAVWLRRQASWMSTSLTEVEQAQKEYNAELAARQADTAKQIATLEQELALTLQKFAAAQTEVAEASRREEDARKELAEATAGRLLAHYVEDRANSTDYRKHLGVLALVRNDFERLSNLIVKENERLAALQTIDLERIGEKMRINRIVLYIDDLDRCPPAKVVDVLQAVHLLLAFELFVVVVGVDARWTARSLETRYREMLHAKEFDATAEFHREFGVASTQDYLEKIFQIPFWLQPLDVPSSQRMLRSLLSKQKEDRDGSASADLDRPGPAAGSPDDPARTPVPDPTVQRDAPAPMPGTRAQHPVQPASSVEGLEIRDFELGFIQELAPLLGRSPRALKRFVNVYRLIKASLSAPERTAFLRREEEALSAYEAVLFLLAVDTGLPEVAPHVFSALSQIGEDADVESPGAGARKATAARTKKSKNQADDDVDWLVRDIRSDGSAVIGGEWAKLKEWINEHRAISAEPGRLQLGAWAPRVARFTFRTTKYKLDPATQSTSPR